jgi:hypothetical protein
LIFIWMFWIILALVALAALWHSPLIFHRASAWLHAYNACVETRENAKTLQDWYAARQFCARQANRATK